MEVEALPRPRPPRFVGRSAELQQLHAYLSAGRNVVVSQRPNRVSRAGGVGKTLLALEYAWDYGEDYEGVFWLRGGGKDLTLAFAALAGPLGLGRDPGEPAERAAAAVRRALGQGGPWLLVLDGVDHPWSYPHLLPPMEHTRAIITSRRRDLLDPEILSLDLPVPGEALELLGGAGAHHVSIVEALERLPLSLEIARRVIEVGGVAPVELLEELREGVVVSGAGKDPWFEDHPAHARLLELALAMLDPERGRLARAAVAVSGGFASVGVPPALLEAAARVYDPGATGQIADALSDAVALGFATRDRRGWPVFHQRVRAWARGRGDGAGVEAARAALVAAMGSLEAPEAAPLHPHLYESVRRMERGGPAEHAWLPLQLARFMRGRGVLAPALRICKRALQTVEDPAWSAWLVHESAQILIRQGRPGKAHKLFLQGLSLAEGELGADHPAVVAHLQGAGDALAQGGAVTRARSYFQLALESAERVGGPSHPAVARAHFAIGQSWLRQGEPDLALGPLQSAVAVARAALGSGPEGPPDEHDAAEGAGDEAGPPALAEAAVLATALSTLGRCRLALEEPEAAEVCLEEALEIQHAVLGLDHPSTAATLAALAGVRRERGDLPGALVTWDQALESVRAALGAAHPDALVAQLERGRLMVEMGDPYGELEIAEATRLLGRVLGEEHPLTKAARE